MGNFVDVSGALKSTETANQKAIQHIMETAADPEDTAALEAVAAKFKTDEEVDDEISAEVAAQKPEFSHEQVHAELQALREGKLDSLFRADGDE